MSSRKIEDLTPELQVLHKEWLIKCSEAGVNVITTCTARSYQEQMALYAQGRQPLDEVNKLRLLAGMPAITASENSRRVTWTMASRHIINLHDDVPDNDKAYAFDYAILNEKRQVVWDIKLSLDDDDIPDYLEAARIGESVGLEAGAFWTKPDYPHLQLRIKPIATIPA